MCVKRVVFFSSAAGSIEGEGVLVISSVTFSYVPSLSSKVHQISGQAAVTLHVTLNLRHRLYPETLRDLSEKAGWFIFALNLFATSRTSLVHIYITADLTSVELLLVFSNWIADGTPERISHATLTNIHWLIGSIQQLIHCDTLIFIGNEIWRNCWPLVWLQQLDFQIPGIESKDSGFRVYWVFFF